MNFFFNKNKPPTGRQCDFTAAAEDISRVNGNRPMKFPYTFSAKIAQFPFKHHFKHSWMWRYYVYGVIASIPIFYYIGTLANSPGNIAKWAEIKRKEEEEWKHKFD